MATWLGWSRGAVGVALVGAAFASGCGSQAPSSFASGSGSYAGGYGGGSSSGANPQAMLAVVDTGATFDASSMAGGQGVGVFVEYQAGGHWTVQWTCDTAVSSLDCHFQIDVTLTGAAPTSLDAGSSAVALTNVQSQLQSENGQVTQANGSELDAMTTTFSAIDGMSFDAPAGATITLDAKINGEDNGAFIFFVQDGKVNGGYTGTLSDPIELEPSTP
jgi:hypothetical protein